ANPKEELKGITTRSSVAYQGPTNSTPPKVVKQGNEVTKDQVQAPSSQSTAPVQPPVSQSETPTSISEPVVAPVSAPMPNVKSSTHYPLRRDNERRPYSLLELTPTCMTLELVDRSVSKPIGIGKDVSFKVVVFHFPADFVVVDFEADPRVSLILGRCFLKTGRALIDVHKGELTLRIENEAITYNLDQTVRMDEYLALANLGASINLMPLSVWEAFSVSELTPTCMTLELADRSVSKPIGIAKNVSFKVVVFHFPADFVVVDFEADPRVPLILGRCFLNTGRALIDVHKGELTLRIGNEAITYNLDQTVRYSANYNQMTANKIDVICEQYSQEVLGFVDTTASGNTTPHDDPIVSTTEPLPPLPKHEQYFPSFKKELKVCEAKTGVRR
nr:reverse transcriptase domain-containing protein [Tanacetum cinerariifolium]